MEIYIERKNKTLSMKFSGRVKTLLIKLKINPETVIVTKNNEIVSDDDSIYNKDKIKIISVISGG